MAARDDKRTIQWLVLFGLGYNVAEGILCVSAGVAAGSVVLIGFGLDSGIEALAALAAWRFLRRENQPHRSGPRWATDLPVNNVLRNET